MWKKKKHQKENDTKENDIKSNEINSQTYNSEPIYSMEKFYNICQKFFDNGLVTPLYETDHYCLCNIANDIYMIVADINQDYGAAGFLITIKEAKKIIKKYEGFFEFFLKIQGTDEFSERILYLNDRTFDFVVELKNKTDREGPSKFVNLKFDQYLLSQYKNK